MTLIVASAQQDVQFIVADRRISRPPTGTLVDDWAYKVVQYWNREQGYQFLVAYTGLAELTGQSTLDWLMQSLPEVFDTKTDIYRAISALPNECERELGCMGTLPLSNKALTILFCGRYNRFGPDLRNPQFVPFATVISNCVDQSGRQTKEISHHFRAISWRVLKAQGYITLCRGDLRIASAYAKEFRQARRLIRRPISYRAKIDIAVGYIRKVADKSKAVGKNILGAALLQPGESEAFDLPENADVMTKTMPHVICADGSRFTDFKVKPITTENAGEKHAN